EGESVLPREAADVAARPQHQLVGAVDHQQFGAGSHEGEKRPGGAFGPPALPGPPGHTIPSAGPPVRADAGPGPGLRTSSHRPGHYDSPAVPDRRPRRPPRSARRAETDRIVPVVGAVPVAVGGAQVAILVVEGAAAQEPATWPRSGGTGAPRAAASA